MSTSASARISKGQGYQGFLKKDGEQFWPKKGNLRHTRKNLKNGQNFTPFWVNKMLSYMF
jgi:ribosomal protein L3